MKTLQLVDRYLSKENLKEDHIVIFRSPNGETDWVMLTPDQHPEWIKHPQVIGHLLRSNDAGSHPSDPGAFYTVFTAEQVVELSKQAPDAPTIAQRRPRLVGADGKLIH